MRKKVTKAIFPVAGLGTRFLPATKSVPKEIMTLVDRPLIQYAIDEAREAGIKEFIFVTSRGKGALEDYFDHSPVLEQELRKKNKTELLDILKATNMDSGAIAYIRQHRALGLGHAVWCARRLIANEPLRLFCLMTSLLAKHHALSRWWKPMLKPVATWWLQWKSRLSKPRPTGFWTCRTIWVTW